MTDQSGLGGVSKLPGGVSGLVDSVLSAGAGGTVTQDMVDQANTLKPAADNG